MNARIVLVLDVKYDLHCTLFGYGYKTYLISVTI